MLQTYQLTERCSCGATFTTESHSQDALKRAASEWRTEHRHEFPPPPERSGDVQYEHRDNGSAAERSWKTGFQVEESSA